MLDTLKIIFVCLLLFICYGRMQSITYIYRDGNSNSYIIQQGQVIEFEYLPVTIENSSSGMYSEGMPVKKNISQNDFEDFKKLSDMLK